MITSIENAKFYAYVYDIVEHNLGSENRLDGYECFYEKTAGEAWVENEHDELTDPLPDFYRTYENPRWVEVPEAFYNTLVFRGYYWVGKLPQLI